METETTTGGILPEGMQAAALLQGLSKKDLSVILHICRIARADRCWPGFTQLAAEAGVDRRTVEQVFQRAERRGILKRHFDYRNRAPRMKCVEVVPINIKIICAV